VAVPLHPRGFLVNLAIAALAVCVTLGALELGLRLFWKGYYLKERKAYAQPHPTRGWENRHGARVHFGKPEFSTTVEHNSVGFRGPEVSLAKTPGSFRILALGDSFTYGVGVENDATFCAVLEELDLRLEVINAGVNNYGTSQELLLLKERGLAYRPDLVLTHFFWNDVADSATREFPTFSMQGGALRYPTFRTDADPPLVRWPRQRTRLLRRSYAYRFLSDRKDLLDWRIRIALGIPVDDPTLLEPEEVEPAWVLVRALLLEMDRLSREAGARFGIVVIPDQTQVEPAAGLRVLGLREADLAVQERLVSFGRESGIPVIDLLPALEKAAAAGSEPLYYRKDRHLTVAGHRAVAEILHRELSARGLL
jgi:lysophospholipase L1-like esterase